MIAGENPPLPTTPRRLKKRVVLPTVILGILLALFGALWARGTLASPDEKNPGSAADGVLTQLYLTAAGRKVVRCAAVLDQPVERVWKAVTDYENFESIFPTVKAVKTLVEPDGRHRLAGDVTSILGTWPIDIRIRHEAAPESYIASWDEPTGDVVVNRGSWSLVPLPPGSRTRVVYTLDVEVRHFPDVLVRAVLLSRQKTVLAALKSYLDKPSP